MDTPNGAPNGPMQCASASGCYTTSYLRENRRKVEKIRRLMTVELKGYPVCNNSIIMATRPRWHCPITSPPNKRTSTHSRMRTSTLVYTRPSRPKVYNARHLERIPLYRTVAEHFETWFEFSSAGQFDGQGDHHTPPAYVEQAFRKYLSAPSSPTALRGSGVMTMGTTTWWPILLQHSTHGRDGSAPG